MPQSMPTETPPDQAAPKSDGPLENGLVHQLADQMDGASRRIADWKSETGRLIREHPAAFIVGAVVVGFALAKVARHA
jgi:hypothetical protein